MKNAVQILAILFLFQLNSYAQRLVKEDCIGTDGNEQIVKTHENDDSTLTIIYSTQNTNNFTYQFKTIKLDKDHNITIRRNIDTIEYFGQNNLESLIHFEKDGSFILSSISSTNGLVFKYYDNAINNLWTTIDTTYNTTYFRGIYNTISKKLDGGFIILNYNNGLYASKYNVLSLSNKGAIEWNHFFDVSSYFDLPYNYSNSPLTVISKPNGKTFISLNSSAGGALSIGFSQNLVYNIILDSLGNQEYIRNFYSPNYNFIYVPNNGFNNIKSEQLENFPISYYKDSTKYTIVLNTNNLQIVKEDSLKNSNLITEIYTPGELNDSSNIFYVTSSLIDTSQTIYCKSLIQDSIWNTKIPYGYFSIYSNQKTIVIDNNTLFYNNNLIKNGIKLWHISLNMTDTIIYKGILSTSYDYNIFKSKYNNQYLNIVRSYSNNMILFMTIDINLGDTIQDVFIENISEMASYINYNSNKKTTFLASTNYSTCHFGSSDIYLATYSDDFNTIKGIVYIDYNNNNTKENNEPIYPYGYVTTTSIRDTQTQHLSAGFPFFFFTDSGSYVTKLNLYNNYYNSTPLQFTNNHNDFENIDMLLFALHPIAGKNDIKIELVNNWMTRLGQENDYTISIENKGTTYGNGKVKVLLDNRLLNITANPNYTYRSGDTLVWSISNLLPTQKLYSTIHFTAETPTILNAGDTLFSKAWFESDSIDLTPIDNYSVVNEIIKASYDPNEKTITNGENLTQAQIISGAYISYIVHFENKGNDTAFKVIVIDTLSDKVDVSSLQIINASHAYTLEILNGRILKFTFNNIRLSYDSLSSSSKGFIAYKLKPKSDIALGSTIDNIANIFFDYNQPIRTNTAQAKMLLLTAINTNKNINDGILDVYPNPNNGIFTVKFESKKNTTIQLQLLDVTGNIIYQESKQHQNKTAFSINQTNVAKGIYWLKLNEGSNNYSRACIVQ